MFTHIKKILFTTACLMTLSSAASAQFPDRDSLGSIAQVTPGSRLIRFHEKTNISPAQLFEQYGSKFGLGTNDYMVVRDTSTDSLTGLTRYRFGQLHNGVPVNEGDYLVRAQLGRCKTGHGFIMAGLNVPDEVTLDEQQAFDLALEHIGALTYMWEIPGEEALLQADEENPEATYYPTGLLMVAAPNSEDYNPSAYRMAYRFNVFAAAPESRDFVYVDANSGEIVKTETLICNATGTAETLYDGTQTIKTDYNASRGEYRLKDNDRGNGVRTKDLNNGSATSLATNIWDGDNYWDTKGVATQAHWGLEKAWDYYYYEHGLYSFNGSGKKVKAYIHWKTDHDNAAWNGTCIKFGDGLSTETAYVSVEVAAHELTHAVDDHHSNLKYSGESGALDESFADIFGTCVEWYADPTGANWLMGDDLNGGVGFRSMSNPSSATYKDPDTYKGTYWYTGSNNGKEVHTNSGVQNYWFYLLCQGGSGTNDNGVSYDVPALGMDKAARIAFATFTDYLTRKMGYGDARDASIQATEDIYGACSDEQKAVIEAWKAVGLGQSVEYTWYLSLLHGSKICTPFKLKLGTAFLVMASDDLDVISQSEINLTDGFHAESGSQFTAKIGCCY